MIFLGYNWTFVLLGLVERKYGGSIVFLKNQVIFYDSCPKLSKQIKLLKTIGVDCTWKGPFDALRKGKGLFNFGGAILD